MTSIAIQTNRGGDAASAAPGIFPLSRNIAYSKEAIPDFSILDRNSHGFDQAYPGVSDQSFQNHDDVCCCLSQFISMAGTLHEVPGFRPRDISGKSTSSTSSSMENQQRPRCTNIEDRRTLDGVK